MSCYSQKRSYLVDAWAKTALVNLVTGRANEIIHDFREQHENMHWSFVYIWYMSMIIHMEFKWMANRQGRNEGTRRNVKMECMTSSCYIRAWPVTRLVNGHALGKSLPCVLAWGRDCTHARSLILISGAEPRGQTHNLFCSGTMLTTRQCSRINLSRTHGWWYCNCCSNNNCHAETNSIETLMQ